MKYWTKGSNVILEFEQSEHEALRMSMGVSSGERWYKLSRDKYPNGYISVVLMNHMITEFLISDNYDGMTHGEDSPIVMTAKRAAKNILKFPEICHLNVKEYEQLAVAVIDGTLGKLL